jgi:glucose/arabinose dehydrogenase
MKRGWLVLGAVAVLGVVAGAALSVRDRVQERAGITLEPVAADLEAPVYLTAPPGDPRLFVVEQRGRIRVIRDGRLLPRPFLDISEKVGYGGERGLLGLAFHPRYAANGRFYVNYTDRHGDTRVERYGATPSADTADPSSARPVLFVAQPYANHNGGDVLFGPDGMLYVGMGDGGSGGDPHGNGQSLGTLLGKLLRLDVDHAEPYAVPADNPFVGRSGARPEIWAYGLRNPWRLAFDSTEGLLYSADVGQNLWEEVDVAPAGAKGLNYGWNRMEGAHCYGIGLCSREGLTLPALEYGHGDGCAIVGGFVYRGRALPAETGRYFYSDYCSGWLRSFRYENGAATESHAWRVRSPGPVLSFGEDAAGELYLLAANGTVYQLAPDRGAAR